MSIDRSLKVRSGLLRQRNVWTRAERIEALRKQQKWAEGDSVLGLPKVRTVWKRKKKPKAKDEDAETATDETGAEGTETPAAE